MTDTEKSQQIAMMKDVEYSSVLKLRLDTSQLLQQIEIYLTGKIQSISTNDKGRPTYITKKISEPKANEEGIHWLLNFCSNIINPSTVQGNWLTSDMYYSYLFDIRSSLIYNLMKNMHVWGIKEYDYEPIIDSIMSIIEPFMTRPLGNKERESYGGLKVIESSSSEIKNRGFSLINRGK